MMRERISLEAALRSVWESEFGDAQAGRCLVTSEFQDLLSGTDSPSKNEMLVHLSRCPRCSSTLGEMCQAMEQVQAAALDIALPKLAAARQASGFVKISTEGGKYTIVLRRSLKEHRRGLVTVGVSADLRPRLEGATLTLKDGQGRCLVTGTVVNGEVSQVVPDLDGIDMTRFIVECR